MSQKFWGTCNEFPVTKALQGIFAPKTLVNPKAKAVIKPSFKTHSNVDIVSPDLCKDALRQIHDEYLPYRGCDIIDINPGACVWTKQIHDFLKPRRHLLLEPDIRYVKPFLQPLLDEPGSTYRHSALKPTHHAQYWSTYSQIFNDELLPRRSPLHHDDPQLRELNKTLLLTGNVHRLHKDAGVKADLLANTRLIVTHFIQSSQNNSMFHSYGLVRMLLWAPREFETVILPWSLNMRGGRSVIMSLGADTTEVVAPPTTKESNYLEKTQPRPDSFSAVAVLNTLRSMEERKMTLPKKARLNKAQLQALEDRANVEGTAERIDPTKDYNLILDHATFGAKLEGLERDIGTFMAYTATRLPRELLSEPIKHTTSMFLQNDLYKPFEIQSKNLFADYMQLSFRQVTLEAQLFGCREGWADGEAADAERRLLKTTRSLRAALLGTGTSHWVLWARRYTGMLNEQLALTRKPAVLVVDRRPYLPIRAKAQEFWPAIPSMLLDIKPRQTNFASDFVDKHKATDLARSFIRGTFQWRKESLASAIDHFTQDASEDIYAAVPELKDARKGGRLDPEDLALKSVSNEMLEKVVRAYLEWPFRPDDSTVLAEGMAAEETSGDELGVDGHGESADGVPIEDA